MFKQLTNTSNLLRFFLAALLIIVCAGRDYAHARTVNDETGRRINIRNVPKRIVSLAPGITETLYALGLSMEIVGVTTFCDWPQEARKKPRVGGFVNPSVEKIVSLKPDLILATADGNRKDTVVQLERLGLPVYVINPANTEGVLKSILHIGEITKRENNARKLAGELQKKLDNVTSRVRNKNKPRIFFQFGLDPIITAGKGTLTHEVIEQSGGINVAGHDTASYPRYSIEGIIGKSPEIIIYAPMVDDKEFAAVKRFWQKFEEIPAVKNNKIYVINANLINRASPRIFEAIEIMASMMHPEIKDSGQ